VWFGHDGNDWEIFLYNGLTVIQLTNNEYDDREPQIKASGSVVWSGHDGNDWEIFIYNGSTPIQLTNNAYDDIQPQINAIGQVVWSGYDGTDMEIFLDIGNFITQLTSNDYDDQNPQIGDTGEVVWHGFDSTDYEIFRYNGSTTKLLTNNSYNDRNPRISDSGVVWSGYDGNDWEIFSFNYTTGYDQLTNNEYDDRKPQINASGRVVWTGIDGIRWEIVRYDPMSMSTILWSDTFIHEFPQISGNGQVVWHGHDGNDWEIFLWNGSTTIQLTDNSFDDVNPQINDSGQLVWERYETANADIFLATPASGSTPSGTDIVTVPEDSTSGETPITITFADVTTGGETTLTTTETGTGTPPLPTGLRIGNPPTYYEISTTAEYSGDIEVCIDYTDISYGNENNLRLFHDDGQGGWDDITSSLDTENNIICGIVSSFSHFVVLEPTIIALSGIITEVSSTPPAPFSEVVVGDTWTLSYTFDTSVLDVDGSPSAGQYQNPVTEMTLTIGSDTVTGVPGTGAIPGEYDSVIAVNLGTGGYADYTAQVSLPDSSAWAQVALYDDDGTPFVDDSLPPALPTPLKDNFPDLRRFFLRQPGSTGIFLIGENVNVPPVFDPIGSAIVYEGNELVINVNAIDLDSDSLTYAVKTPPGLPAFASFDPLIQRFIWEPRNNQAGRYFVIFTVDDGINPIVEERVEITVMDNDGGQRRVVRQKKVVKKQVIVGKVSMSMVELETSYDLDITFTNSIPENPNVTTTVFEGCSADEGFLVNGECFDVTADAISFDSVEICVTFDDTAVNIASLELEHYDADFETWEPITTTVDTTGNKVTICGLTETLSPFFVTTNVLPVIGEIEAPLEPQPVNTPVNISSTFTDDDSADTHTAVYDWGDGSTSNGEVDQISNTVTGSHTYIQSGVYTIKLTVQDSYSASGEAIHEFVVIYNPEDGFVTGAGWIDSPPAAYIPDTSLTGKANFGFVSKYKKGATTPTGSTEFQFHAVDFNFHSRTYEWLVIAGTTAKFKGSGTINGDVAPDGSDYLFKLWAGDDEPDTFHIKIWWEDVDGVENVIYDNIYDQPIVGGSIVIHTKEK
jgi:hypothetical protein